MALNDMGVTGTGLGAAFTGAVSASESASAGGILTVVNSHTTPTSPSVQYTAQTAADLVLGVDVTGDTVNRLTIDSNGLMSWGAGGASATDTTLSRSSAGQLSTGAMIMSSSKSGGQVLKVANTHATPTAPNLILLANSAADAEIGIGLPADTVYRLAVDSNGKMLWGPGGSTAGDTNLYRNAAGVLKTDDQLVVGNGLAVTGTVTGVSGQYLCTPAQYVPAGQVIIQTTSATFASLNATATTVASGSNGGEISTVASWAVPSAGVLDVASTAGWPSAGTFTVATSTTTATVTYTGVTSGSLTGCAYVSGSATGTVATGGAVTLTVAGSASAVPSVSTGPFTAPASGSVMATASAVTQVSSSGDQFGFGLAAHGTLTPMVGYIAVFKDPATTQPTPKNMQFLVTGLTPGTSYNFDLMFVVAGGGTLSVYAQGQTGTTPNLANSGMGSPVVMSVQAV